MKKDITKRVKIPINIKTFFSDSLWSILALVLMNVISQFIVYPVWSKIYGSEPYGNIVYAMSIINIFAISLGSALNYTRMVDSAKKETQNGDYNIILCVIGPFASLACTILSILSIPNFSLSECLLIGILCYFTTWRYYADVEYRLNLNYKGYFKYYTIISIGYLIGILLFLISGLWPLTLLPGEIIGLIYVWKKGKIFRNMPITRTGNFPIILKNSSILIITNIISNVIFNGDRLLLQNMLGGGAVTTYYLASLIGKTMTLITTPLNSVMIGHLAKYKKNFTLKNVAYLVLATLLGIIIGTLGSYLGSHIVIRILYPENHNQVKEFFLLANLSQIVYFITNILTTFLLRVANTNCQLVINIFYAFCFITICLFTTMSYGIWGFCISLLIVNILRYLLAVAFCVMNIKKQ